jgi:hypothetical protein
MKDQWGVIPATRFGRTYWVSSEGVVAEDGAIVPQVAYGGGETWGHSMGVQLDPEGKKPLVGVHQLMARAFMGWISIKHAPIVHLDGQRSNNHIKNLRLVGDKPEDDQLDLLTSALGGAPEVASPPRDAYAGTGMFNDPTFEELDLQAETPSEGAEVEQGAYYELDDPY